MTDFTRLRIDVSEERPVSATAETDATAASGDDGRDRHGERVGDSDTEDGTWSALFAGDCIYKGRLAADPVAPAVAERIRAADVSVVNLEAPVRGGGEPAGKVGPAHASHPETPARLAAAGFDVACLANNHLMDYGTAGLRVTREACADAGLATLGAGDDLDAALAPFRTRVAVGGANGEGEPGEAESNGTESVELAVVNACEREFGVATADEPGVGWLSHPSTERRVAEAARSADVTVVVAHGGVEYVPFPPAGFGTRLRTLVDAGADAVVAHHPHVPQGWELYEGAPILYSLGNFLFDSKRSNTRWGLLAEFDFRGRELAGVTLLPTELHEGRVHPLGVEGGRTDGGRPVDAHLDYLRASAEIVADRDALRSHWQELAVRLFDHRYVGWLRRGTGAGLSQLVTDPRAAVGGRAFPADGRRTEQLTLLNVVRNESHRDVVETALALRAGDLTDRREPGVDRTVRDLLDWTENEVAAMYGEGAERGMSSRLRSGARAAGRRVAAVLRELR
ncbi:CapA family protein [Halobium salinum]|uniref:CapA family protein n=1 Tax=Halobium salinum TaxID=1364940 RepID=A0ABD5PBU9_9EURY|nr:CapA family protein [Halobium salinum]